MGVKRLTEKEILYEINKFGRPFTAAELAKEFEVSGQAIGKYLQALATRGMTAKIKQGNASLWIGGDEIIAGLVQAFPCLIAFYKRRNPRHAKYLEAEWDHLLERGFAQWEV